MSHPTAEMGRADHDHGHGPHRHPVGRSHGGHGHSHGLVDPSIVRSRDGVRTVAVSLVVLGVTAAAQVVIFTLSGSVALLADLIHNVGDALTAIPLGIAFFIRSYRAEKILACSSSPYLHLSLRCPLRDDPALHPPEQLTHLWALAAAGGIGFAGNEIAAQVRLRGGRRLLSPALIADGKHARADGYVSLAVVVTAVAVAAGYERTDPNIGLLITLVILKITWDSWRVISTAEPGGSHRQDQ